MNEVESRFIQRCIVTLVDAVELEQQHRRGLHPEQVVNCPVCYNNAVVDAKIADGEVIGDFEISGSLSPNEIGGQLCRRVGL